MMRYGLVLTIVCLSASLVLAFSYELTKEKIEQQRIDEINRSLEAIFPDADSYERNEIEDTIYYRVIKDNTTKGYILTVEAKGYNGPVNTMVGVDMDGKIAGVIVLEHKETPGLGANIVEIKRGEKEPWFLRQFKGKLARNLVLGEDIQAITGATISSEALTSAIKGQVQAFLRRIRDDQ